MKVYLSNKGEQSSPFSAPEIRAKLRAGQLTNKTLYWHEGMEEWELASELVEGLETPSQR